MPVIEYNKICDWFEEAHQFLLTIGQRRLVVLSGNLAWSNGIAQALLDRFNDKYSDDRELRWKAYGSDFTVEQSSVISNFRHHLGSENDLVFYADPDFHADAFAALSGTLVAGGIMLWFCPEVKYRTKQVKCDNDVFIQRIWQKAHEDKNVLFLSPSCSLPQISLAVPAIDKSSLNRISGEKLVIKGCCTLEQQSAVIAILKVATGHRKRPLVLTADRGRGKSTALALAVSNILMNAMQAQTIVVTAPHQQALVVFFKQLKLSCEQGKYHQHTFSYLSHTVKFIAIDQLIKRQVEATVLLIDEAAGIPVYLLNQLTDNYARIVYSSTLHGYEGAGRGFTVKFLPQLKIKCPNFKHLHINQPIRWSVNDGLENFVFNSFLLSANSELSVESITAINTSSSRLKVKEISQQQLLADEALLVQIFAVLVTAHYQTSPSDLKLLLSNPQVKVFASFHYQQVVAVALCLIEGSASTEQITQVSLSERRLKNQFLPQSLYLHNGIENAFDFRYLRIMRIAVHPSVQNHRIGSVLLAKIKCYAELEGFDILGSSFGATTQLISFWLSAGYQVARIGITCDQASGEHSALLLQSLNDKAKIQVELIGAEFYKSFNFYLSEQFQQLSPNLVTKIITRWPKSCLPQLVEQEEKSVGDYIDKKRLYQSCLYSLNLWLLRHISQNGGEVEEFLIARILQRWSTEVICSVYGFTGKKQLEQSTRKQFELLINGLHSFDR